MANSCATTDEGGGKNSFRKWERAQMPSSPQEGCARLVMPERFSLVHTVLHILLGSRVLGTLKTGCAPELCISNLLPSRVSQEGKQLALLLVV